MSVDVDGHNGGAWKKAKSVKDLAKKETRSGPTGLDQGQLSADWQELQDILKSKKEPISYALVWLSSLIRKIGEDITV